MTRPATMLRFWLMFIAGLVCLILPVEAEIAEPDGYRLDDYRAETPSTLLGASVIDARELRDLMLHDAVVVIDVLPQPPRPPELPATTFWHAPARRNIPGSIWLANVGYGNLSDEMDGHFRDVLGKMALGNMARKFVFYCDAECWMSWNAAKRALEYGYRNVYWFPGGVQAWIEAGYPTMLNAAIPVK